MENLEQVASSQVDTVTDPAVQATVETPANDPGDQKQNEITPEQQEIKNLRKESASYRTRYNDAVKQAELYKAELDAKTERLNNLESDLKETKVQTAFNKAASDSGAIYPDAVYKLISTADLKINDDGTPDVKSLDTVIQNLQKQYPAMFKSIDGKTIDAAAGGQTAVSSFDKWLRPSA